MKTIRRTLALLPALLLGPIALGQAPSELRETKTVIVPGQTANTIIDPIKCDPNSNIYYRLDQGSGDFMKFPTLRISPDGRTFVFPAPTSENSSLDTLDFSPAPGGGLLLLTTSDYKAYDLEFLDGHGELQLKSRLPAGLDPLQVALSPSGKVLVSGLMFETGLGGTQASRTFTGIFDRTAKLLQEVSLIDDVQPGDSGTPSDAPHFRQLLGLSSAQASTNGSFVLARLAFGGPIHVISPEGRDLDGGFRPAIPKDAYLSGVQVDGDMVAAMSLKKKTGTTQNEISDVSLSLWDSQTRKEVGQFYHSFPTLGAAFACFKAGVFTFLSTDEESRVQLVRAVPPR